MFTARFKLFRDDWWFDQLNSYNSEHIFNEANQPKCFKHGLHKLWRSAHILFASVHGIQTKSIRTSRL
jgi:hypothetical protein